MPISWEGRAVRPSGRACSVGNNSAFLDADSRTMIASGDPKMLRDGCPDPKVRECLTRGEFSPSDASPMGSAAG
jgi:hypothetical protein